MRIIRFVVLGAVAKWLWDKRGQGSALSSARPVRPEPLKVWESEGGSVPRAADAEPQPATASHQTAYH